jgi:hypothetical protein
MSRIHIVVAFVLGAGGLAAAAPDAVTLRRKLTKGTRVRVETRSLTNNTMQFKNAAAKVGSAEETEVISRYEEEVLSRRPERLLRAYELMTRRKGKPGADVEPLRTTLHGRRVILSGLHMAPDGEFEIAKDDREGLKLERLCAALLPPQETVEPRASWSIGSQPLLASLFGPQVAARSGDPSSTAKVSLKTVKKVRGVEAAVLKVRAKLVLQRAQDFPAIELALKGEVVWAIGAGVLLEAELAGPILLAHGGQENGQRTEWQADGKTRWSYVAELLEVREGGDRARKEGRPPPPGAQALVCEHEPKHRFELKHFARCVLCGDALDGERACPNGDPWVYQHCPYDGAPLQPE